MLTAGHRSSTPARAGLRPPGVLAVLAALALLPLTACGKGGNPGASATPTIGPLPTGAVTKNTTRLGDGTPAGNAAAVARAVYPGLTLATRPPAVVLVDQHDWRAALAASVLAAAPLKLPLLYTDGSALPPVTRAALAALRPTGAPELNRDQVIAIGDVGRPRDYRIAQVTGADPATLAANIEALATHARGGAPPAQALVVSASAPSAFALPAAGLAAQSGAPILFTTDAGVPPATAKLLAAPSPPALYAIGPDQAMPPSALSALTKNGSTVVKRIQGPDPVSNAIAVARYADSSFGWGVVDPGHGLAFVNYRHPLDAPAAALLAANGDYAPTLLLDGSAALPPALASYLAAIEPGYTNDPRFRPVRGVYNRGWLIGGPSSISAAAQAQIDALLEITQRTGAPSTPLTSP